MIIHFDRSSVRMGDDCLGYKESLEVSGDIFDNNRHISKELIKPKAEGKEIIIVSEQYSKNNFLLLLLLISILSFTSCNDGKMLIYSKPTMAQVNEFISKEKVDALDIKEANNFTVVLYRKGFTGYGHYVLYKDQYNKLYSTYVKAWGDREQSVFLEGVASGKTPFVTIIINDKGILQKAREVQVTLEDGRIIKDKINGRGKILMFSNEKSTKPIGYTKIVIYDKDMKKIYEH